MMAGMDWEMRARELVGAGFVTIDSLYKALRVEARVTRDQVREWVRENPFPHRVPSAPDDPERIKSLRTEALVKQLQSDVKKYDKLLLSQDELFERFLEVSQRSVPVPRFEVGKRDRGKPARSVVLPIFDQQYGQLVRPADTPGNRGLFDTSVFDGRLERYVKAATSIIAQQATAYQIPELVIVLGGDHVEGDEIFRGQAWQLEYHPLAQAWDLAVKMEAALTEIVRFARGLGVERVACYAVPGNHGKVGGKQAGAKPADYSWDTLFARLLVDPEKGWITGLFDEVAIEPAGAVFFYCGGHEFQAIHGDEVKGWGGLPFYGLTRFDGRSMRLHNRLYRYLLMGHHHQPGEIPNGAGETIVSGDWVGANNLSRFIQAASRPQQRVIFVSEKWGVTGSERIWLTDAQEAYEPTAIYGEAA